MASLSTNGARTHAHLVLVGTIRPLKNCVHENEECFGAHESFHRAVELMCVHVEVVAELAHHTAAL